LKSLNVELSGDNLEITYNSALISLEGITNMDPSTILDIDIFHNPLLSTCAVNSICDAMELLRNDSITI